MSHWSNAGAHASEGPEDSGFPGVQFVERVVDVIVELVWYTFRWEIATLGYRYAGKSRRLDPATLGKCFARKPLRWEIATLGSRYAGKEFYPTVQDGKQWRCLFRPSQRFVGAAVRHGGTPSFSRCCHIVC